MTDFTHSAAPARRPFAPIALLLRLLALHRERHKLQLLDDRLLRDIGATPEQAASEAARPVWDAPHHWLHQG